jgi:hypothetical protein
MGSRDRTGPGVPFPGPLRAGDADREQVIDLVKAAFVQGRLTRDELGLYTGRALESRTYAQLAAVTAGLAAVRPSPHPARTPASVPARRAVPGKLVAAGAAAIVLAAASWAAFLTYYGGFVILFLLAFAGMALSAGPWPPRHGTATCASVRRK